MKLRIAGWIGTLVVMWVSWVFPQTPFVSSCAEDAHIDTAKRKSIDAATTEFVQTLLGPNPSAAVDLMTRAGQAATTRAQIEGTGVAIARQFQLQNVNVQHTYLIELKGKSPGKIVCSTDLLKPQGWESVSAESVPEQTHVLLSANSRNHKIAFAVWLIPENGRWKVQSFRLNVSTLADKDSIQLWDMARAQEAQKHFFNAALLYAAAAQTADRGPDFQLGIAQSIASDLSKLAVPPEIKGQPPFTWKNGEVTYTVKSIGPIAVAGKIYVIISHEVSPWESEPQVDAWNKEMLSYFRNRFPEYSDVFSGVVARAVERGGTRGYGTVEELPNKK